MAGQNIPVSFNLTSGVFSEQAVRSELAGMRATDAFKQELQDISGNVPGPLGGGTIKEFLITDNAAAYGRTPDTRVPGEGYYSVGDQTYRIYMNPDLVKFNPEDNNRSMSVAELLAHEFGHATDEGLKATADYRNQPGDITYQASEAKGYEYETKFDQEKGLTPIPNEVSPETSRAREAGEAPSYLYGTSSEQPEKSYSQQFWDAISSGAAAVWDTIKTIGTYISDSIITPAQGTETGAQPGQYFQETQTFQEQLSTLPASPDPQVQSGDIVAPPWETDAKPVDFIQETLNFQQLSSSPAEQPTGPAPAEQPMEQQSAIPGDTTASSAFLMSNESGLISFESPNGTPVVDSTGFQNNGINNTQGVDTITGSPTFDQIMQTFDQTVANTNVDNNPAPIDNYPTQAPVDNYPAPVDNFGGSFGGTGYPLVLDLAGKGIKITPLSSSNQFFNMTDDGYQHRTAWAAAGNGVLVLDLSNTGKIDSPKQFEFTAWDPSAKTDMQALKDVFDTNHNGKLDAGDANWASFKVMVTNPDGTTTLTSLSALGITSIDLTPNKNTIVLPDGSRIEGQTTFTRADGTTGAAADVALTFDPAGYATQQTKTVNADGSTAIDVKALNPDGSLANETVSTTSADGLTKKLQYDHNGIGTFDQVQTDVTVNNADGSQTETLSNIDVAGALINKTITTTSADGKTVTIGRDLHGGGTVDQSESRVIAADGSTTITLSDLAANGALKDKTVVTTSADGLSKTVQIDRDGDGVFDLTENDVTVVNADGSRTQTISDLNSNGSLRERNVTTTSADGRTKTITSDFNGDGVIDLTQ